MAVIFQQSASLGFLDVGSEHKHIVFHKLFSAVYNTTEDFMGLADFFQRVGNLIEKGVGDLLNFLVPPTVAPPLLPFGPNENGTIAPLATTPDESGATTQEPGTTAAAARELLDRIRMSNLNRKGLFQDQVADLIASGERTDCRLLANQISGGEKKP